MENKDVATKKGGCSSDLRRASTFKLLNAQDFLRNETLGCLSSEVDDERSDLSDSSADALADIFDDDAAFNDVIPTDSVHVTSDNMSDELQRQRDITKNIIKDFSDPLFSKDGKTQSDKVHRACFLSQPSTFYVGPSQSFKACWELTN